MSFIASCILVIVFGVSFCAIWLLASALQKCWRRIDALETGQRRTRGDTMTYWTESWRPTAAMMLEMRAQRVYRDADRLAEYMARVDAMADLLEITGQQGEEYIKKRARYKAAHLDRYLRDWQWP